MNDDIQIFMFFIPFIFAILLMLYEAKKDDIKSYILKFIGLNNGGIKNGKA